jgi:hypothetical protein
MAVLDQSDDGSGTEFHRMSIVYAFPNFVKDASYEAITGSDSTLPSSVYGDPRSLKFPCHSSPATYISMSHFLEQESSLGKVASSIKDRIIKAADYFGIRGHVDTLIEKSASLKIHSERELDDSCFALVTQYDNGNKTRNYPIRNEFELKAAASWIDKFAEDFKFSDRKVIASKILEKAAEFNVRLDNEDSINKLAANGLASTTKAASMLFDRAKALRVLKKDVGIQEMLVKAAQRIIQKGPSDIDKAADIIESVDKHYRISSLGKSTDLYSLSTKIAESIIKDNVQLTNGSVYKKAELEDIKLDELKGVFGDEFAERISSGGLFVDSEKLAEELVTLPRNDANLFDNLVSSLGINTTYKEASFDTITVTDFL